jgi:nitroreductase
MKDLLGLIGRRQSCRSFDPQRAVERDKLVACLEAARLSPSACNSQPWRFVAVDDPQRVEQVARCVQDTKMNRFTECCTCFVVVVEGAQNLSAKVGGSLKNQQYAAIDIGIAAAHLVLAATELGLGSCILGWFNERRLKMMLGIPKTRRVRLVVALGYAAEGDPLREKDRKDFSEVVSFNKF